MNRGDLKRALQQMSYGLYVVGSSSGTNGPIAMIANWVGQVSFAPPLLACSIEHGSKMHEAIRSCRAFSVNILPAGSRRMVTSFLKSPSAEHNSFNEWTFRISAKGTPFLKDALSCVECAVRSSTECGDHTLFIGEVVDLETHGDGAGLTLRETGLNYWKDP